MTSSLELHGTRFETLPMADAELFFADVDSGDENVDVGSDIEVEEFYEEYFLDMVVSVVLIKVTATMNYCNCRSNVIAVSRLN
jgi:hypothetical protein